MSNGFECLKYIFVMRINEKLRIEFTRRVHDLMFLPVAEEYYGLLKLFGRI